MEKTILSIIKKIEKQDVELAIYLRENIVFSSKGCMYRGQKVNSILNRIKIED